MTHGSELPAGGGNATARATELLGVSVSESSPGVFVVSPTGEADDTSADLLGAAARDATAAGPRCLVVDLAGLTFCGSTGLAVLLDAAQDAEAGDLYLGVVGGAPIVRRVLEITGLGPALGHRETLDDVLHDLERSTGTRRSIRSDRSCRTSSVSPPASTLLAAGQPPAAH
jgi:anti-anti-sigma factor